MWVRPRHLWRNVLGRRGRALLFFALLDLIFAWSLLWPVRPLSATYTFANDIMPLWVWAALWGGVGALCAVYAWFRNDWPAWAGAMGIKIAWGSTFLAGWLIADLDRGWVNAGIWLPAAAFVANMATWPDPREDEWNPASLSR